MSGDSTTVIQGQLDRALSGDAEARRRLLGLARDRLTRHARRLLHGPYARLEPFAQTDDVVQQLYIKILQNQDRFWINASGEPGSSKGEPPSACCTCRRAFIQRNLTVGTAMRSSAAASACDIS